MSVGDVNSSERGSGARYNDDKVDLTLLPPASWEVMATEKFLEQGYFYEDFHPYAEEVGALVHFWEGDDKKILEILDSLSADDYEGAAKVFAYGAKKYAKWNWAKGMPWSVPMACYLRHTLLADPDAVDEESGLLHRYHAVCNLIMLGHYVIMCPDMDDRPRELRPEFHRPGEDATAEELGVDEPEEFVGDTLSDAMESFYKQKMREFERGARDVHAYLERLNQGWDNLMDLPTPDLNNLIEELVEEQESRSRTLRATGQLRGCCNDR